MHHFLSYYQAHFIDIFIDTETTVMHVQFRTKHRYNKEKSLTTNLMNFIMLQYLWHGRVHDLSLAGIHQSVLEITRSRAVFAYIMCAVTFDLRPRDPKSNQFIGSARYIHDQSLAGIHQSVLQITRSRERTYVRTDGRTYVRTDGQPENIMPPATS